MACRRFIPGLLLATGTLWCLIQIPAFSQEKKNQRFKSTIVELTDSAPAEWLLKEAKVGAKMISDRDYTISELPKEMEGGTYLLRTQGDHSKWLDANAVSALKEGTVYAMMRWKYLGKQTIDEPTEVKLEREGWKEVEGEMGTTFPNGEDWRWKAYKKALKKGPVNLQLKTIDWRGRNLAVIFVFK